MKKLKQIIFLLTWFAVFMIAGNLDSGGNVTESGVHCHNYKFYRYNLERVFFGTAGGA